MLVSIANRNSGIPAVASLTTGGDPGGTFTDALHRACGRETKGPVSSPHVRRQNPVKSATAEKNPASKRSEPKTQAELTRADRRGALLADLPSASSANTNPVTTPPADNGTKPQKEESTPIPAAGLARPCGIGSLDVRVVAEAEVPAPLSPTCEPGGVLSGTKKQPESTLAGTQIYNNSFAENVSSKSPDGVRVPGEDSTLDDRQSRRTDGESVTSKTASDTANGDETIAGTSAGSTQLLKQQNGNQTEWVAPAVQVPVGTEQLPRNDVGDANAEDTGSAEKVSPLPPLAIELEEHRGGQTAERKDGPNLQIAQFVVLSHPPTDPTSGGKQNGDDVRPPNPLVGDAKAQNQRRHGEGASGRAEMPVDKLHARSGTDSSNPNGEISEQATFAIARTADNSVRGGPASVVGVPEPAHKTADPSGPGERHHADDTTQLQPQSQASTDRETGSRLSEEVSSGGIVNTARLVERLKESEISLNMRSPDFGNVAIHTALSHEKLAAQISLERNDLSKALANEIPSLQSKLSQEQGIHATIEIQQQGSSFSAGSGQSQYQSSRPQTIATQVFPEEPKAEATNMIPVIADGRLDIRI